MPKLSDPKEITINSPVEDKIYTPHMKAEGYYPATFGFESDEDEDDPYGWAITDGAGGNVEVQGSLDGHMKVLKFDDTSYTYNVIAQNNFDSAQTEGTVEWYFKKTSGTTACIFNFWGDGVRPIDFTADAGNNGAWGVRNGGTWIYDYSYEDNTWYHIRVDFDCDEKDPGL